MKITNIADILDTDILKFDNPVLKNLLIDRTTRKNIIWATEDYRFLGNRYNAKSEIQIPLITGRYSKVIQPRVTKAKENQTNRTKDRAEVFTPSWICNEQNNLIDEEWFGRKNIFNTSLGNKWKTNMDKITFPASNKKTWMDYVDAKRMEISCGEAPYLVSRYDSVSGDVILIEDRIGILDRKLRVVNENTETIEDWMKWTIRAFQSTYGYEYQGDNLLLARENLLNTFVDNIVYKFNILPKVEDLIEISKIISWNIWQMDGITMMVPLGEMPYSDLRMPLFANFTNKEEKKKPIPCKIFDWRSNNSLEFRSMVKGEM